MNNHQKEPYYSDYLQLDKLLEAQQPLTPGAHDEMLFIIVHQALELWFKQILHELVSVQRLFASAPLQERALGQVDARLERIVAILHLLSAEIPVLETMTPLDFLEFRDGITPCRFQSLQFREIELRLGVHRAGPPPERDTVGLRENERLHLESLAGQQSLFQLVERWLARMPFLHHGDYDFWRQYLKTTAALLSEYLEHLEHQPTLSTSEHGSRVQQLSETIARFDDLFDPDRYRQLRRDDRVRLSQEAMLAALFIQLYRDEPFLHQPFRVLERLVEIDEELSVWRYQHRIMAQRMLGRQVCPDDGSADRAPRVFEDLFNLASFLVPRSRLPALPEALRRDLGFHFGGDGSWGG